MNFSTRKPVDHSLSTWIDAYAQLKAAQKLVKSAGPNSTLMMRHDVDRLRQVAERALKHLQTEFDAVRNRALKPVEA